MAKDISDILSRLEASSAMKEHLYHFTMEWKGSSTPYGGKIGNREIFTAQGGVIGGCDPEDRSRSYALARFITLDAPSGRHRILIGCDEDEVTAPKDGNVQKIDIQNNRIVAFDKEVVATMFSGQARRSIMWGLASRIGIKSFCRITYRAERKYSAVTRCIIIRVGLCLKNQEFREDFDAQLLSAAKQK